MTKNSVVTFYILISDIILGVYDMNARNNKT